MSTRYPVPMSTDVPAYSIEPIWVVEATYAPDAADTRPAVRPEHLARIAQLRADGTILEAGGYLDLSTALLLVRAASEADAIALFRDDVYMRCGVWVELRAKAYGRVALEGEPTGVPTVTRT
jgi:uncharacterized protein YciI